MSHIAIMILASFAANVGNVSFGIAHTSKGEQIPLRAIVALSAVIAFFSALAVQLGHWLEGRILFDNADEYAEWIAGILFGFIGIRLSLAEHHSLVRKKALLKQEWWISALGLFPNNLTVGLSGGFLGFHPILFGVTLGSTSGLLLWAGTLIGIRQQCNQITWMHRLGAAILLLLATIQFLR